MAARVVAVKPTAKTTKKAAPVKIVAKTPAKKVVIRKVATKVTLPSMVSDPQTANAYIPSLSVSHEYIGRKVQGGVWDIVMLDVALDNHENVLLAGDTGSGKTLLGEAYASKSRLMYYSLPCDVSIDPSSLFGKMTVTDVAGVYKWQDGPVTDIVRNGGVLNVSEVNMMPPRIAASMYSLLDHRRCITLLSHNGEIVRAHIGTKGKDACWCGSNDETPDAECNGKRVLIIGDMNDRYRGTMELNAAFKNRWPHKVPFGYNDEVEEQLLKFPTLRDIAKKCRALSGVEIMTPVSTNLLMEFEKFALEPRLGLDYAIANFVSAFGPDEQSPIEKVLDLNHKHLTDDIAFITGGSKAPVNDEELEEIEFDFIMEEEDV